jgi:invasion protein IalB
MRSLVFAAALLGLSLSAAHAAPEAQDLGTFGNWKAYADVEAGKKLCYLAMKPDKTEGGYKARGNVFLTITHRPATKAFDVVSIVAGYQYKPDSDVAVNIGPSSWSLFSAADRAWARDAATDAAIVKAMAKGTALVAKGTSNRGTPTTDTFTLTGFGKAYKAINDACKKPAK